MPDKPRRKTTTSNEVKQRWKDRNYKRFTLNLRYDTDQDLIDYIDAQTALGVGVTETVRKALIAYIRPL